jgi:hypothetical protein
MSGDRQPSGRLMNDADIKAVAAGLSRACEAAEINDVLIFRRFGVRYA